MVDQLETYIRESLKRGLQKEAIIKQLLDTGWEQENIERAFSLIEPTISPSQIGQPQTTSVVPKTSKKPLIISIIIILFLVSGVTYYLIVSKLQPKPSDQLVQNSPIPSAFETSSLDLGPPIEPPNKIILTDVHRRKLFFYDKDGNFLNECSFNDSLEWSLVSPDLNKIIFYRKKDSIELHLADGNCDSEKTIFSVGKEILENYSIVSLLPLPSWSEDNSKFFFNITFLSPLTSVSPPFIENYLYDLKKDETIQIFRYSYKKDQVDQEGVFTFAGWPKDSQNPFFVGHQVNENKAFYEFDLNKKQFKQIGIATRGYFPPLRFQFFSKDTILWIDEESSWHNPTYKIMLSSLDRSKEEEITPRGDFGEYTAPFISPDKKKIIYRKRLLNTERTSMVYEISSKITSDLGVDLGYVKWVDNNKVLYEKDQNVYSYNIDTKESKFIAKDAYIYYQLDS